MSAWDREAERLDDALEAGEIEADDYDEAMRDLRADQRWAAEEAAEEARDEVLGRW